LNPALKHTIAILLIVTFAAQNFSKWIVILAYEINKEYISNNLCINKTNPSRCCKGKCFLQKKLTADEGQQQSTDKSAYPDTQAELFLHKLILFDLRFPELTIHHNFFYLDGVSREFSSSFFQPPKDMLV
jgi:hypothetical protein